MVCDQLGVVEYEYTTRSILILWYDPKYLIISHKYKDLSFFLHVEVVWMALRKEKKNKGKEKGGERREKKMLKGRGRKTSLVVLSFLCNSKVCKNELSFVDKKYQYYAMHV